MVLVREGQRDSRTTKEITCKGRHSEQCQQGTTNAIEIILLRITKKTKKNKIRIRREEKEKIRGFTYLRGIDVEKILRNNQEVEKRKQPHNNNKLKKQEER